MWPATTKGTKLLENENRSYYLYKKSEKALFRVKIAEENPNFCHVENRRKISNTWKSGSKSPILFSEFYAHTWVPGPIFKSYTSFWGVEGALRGLRCQKLLWFHVFPISEHRNTWKNGPKMPTVFQCVLWPYMGARSNFQVVSFVSRKGGGWRGQKLL